MILGIQGVERLMDGSLVANTGLPMLSAEAVIRSVAGMEQYRSAAETRFFFGTGVGINVTTDPDKSGSAVWTGESEYAYSRVRSQGPTHGITGDTVSSVYYRVCLAATGGPPAVLIMSDPLGPILTITMGRPFNRLPGPWIIQE
jgi:hypothetical protein